MSLLSDAVGVPARVVESLANLPLALVALQRSVDRLTDVCEAMGREVAAMREGVDLLRQEVAVLQGIQGDVDRMTADVETMREGVVALQPAVEGLASDLGRLPFLRRGRGAA
jgi:hypothetical protein